MENASSNHGTASAKTTENNEEVLNWFKRVMTSGNKRLVHKLMKGHQVISDHAWIFQFVDIVYVATIFRISRLLDKCESEAKVYVMCFSYFAIMFSTRTAFDVYTCISGANGILHLVVFSLYGLGVFLMTINISSQDSSQLILTGSNDTLHGFGACESNYNYDLAFAVSFIFTRIVMVVMYGLYFRVFHESNVLGYAPKLDQDFNMTEFARTSDVQQVVRESMAVHPARMLSTDSAHSGVSELSRPSAVFETAAGATRESVVVRHFTRVRVLKVLPIILSSLVMLAVVAGAPTILVYPVVGLIEFTGDFLPSFLIKNAADWRELSAKRHFIQERLGLFFLLVMGESILGLSGVPSHADDVFGIYTILVMAFVTIFSLGLQFFEPLQTYTKPEGPHPLDVQELSPIYTWLVCLTCFFMLIASNGMVQLYSETAHDIADTHDFQGQQKVANGIASVGVLTVVLKVLDKLYYRENLLPAGVCKWLNSFYEQAEEEEMKLHAKKDAPEHEHPGGTVEKPANVSNGIRRIRPLTIARICIAGILYSSQGEVQNKVGFMIMITVLVGFPSLMEVIVELRNFANLHQHQRTMSVRLHSTTLAPTHTMTV